MISTEYALSTKQSEILLRNVNDLILSAFLQRWTKFSSEEGQELMSEFPAYSKTWWSVWIWDPNIIRNPIQNCPKWQLYKLCYPLVN